MKRKLTRSGPCFRLPRRHARTSSHSPGRIHQPHKPDSTFFSSLSPLSPFCRTHQTVSPYTRCFILDNGAELAPRLLTTRHVEPSSSTLLPHPSLP